MPKLKIDSTFIGQKTKLKLLISLEIEDPYNMRDGLYRATVFNVKNRKYISLKPVCEMLDRYKSI